MRYGSNSLEYHVNILERLLIRQSTNLIMDRTGKMIHMQPMQLLYACILKISIFHEKLKILMSMYPSQKGMIRVISG